MADFAAQHLFTGDIAQQALVDDSPAQFLFASHGLLGSSNGRFRMRGMDASVNGLYDVWTVYGSPDFDASEYAGALATPLRAVTLLDIP